MKALQFVAKIVVAVAGIFVFIIGTAVDGTNGTLLIVAGLVMFTGGIAWDFVRDRIKS